jgi:hypothetical protein
MVITITQPIELLVISGVSLGLLAFAWIQENLLYRHQVNYWKEIEERDKKEDEAHELMMKKRRTYEPL